MKKIEFDTVVQPEPGTWGDAIRSIDERQALFFRAINLRLSSANPQAETAYDESLSSLHEAMEDAFWLIADEESASIEERAAALATIILRAEIDCLSFFERIAPELDMAEKYAPYRLTPYENDVQTTHPLHATLSAELAQELAEADLGGNTGFAAETSHQCVMSLGNQTEEFIGLYFENA